MHEDEAAQTGPEELTDLERYYCTELDILIHRAGLDHEHTLAALLSVVREAVAGRYKAQVLALLNLTIHNLLITKELILNDVVQRASEIFAEKKGFDG